MTALEKAVALLQQFDDKTVEWLTFVMEPLLEDESKLRATPKEEKENLINARKAKEETEEEEKAQKAREAEKNKRKLDFKYGMITKEVDAMPFLLDEQEAILYLKNSHEEEVISANRIFNYGRLLGNREAQAAAVKGKSAA